MNRRNFLKTAAAASTLSAMEATAQTTEPKQIVFILGESVRQDMLNCYRQTGLQTPNLDRIAAAGIRFNKAYNCQPVCAPARSAIWTGLSPHTSGVWANSLALGDTTHTIGQHLHDRGIHCGFIGKWHLTGTDYFDTARCPAGWDPAYWYDMRTYLNELTPEDRVLSRKSSSAVAPGGWPEEKCYGYRCTSRALDFIEKNRAESFFLVVSYDEPHDPSLCPDKYTEIYKDFEFPQPENDPGTKKPEVQTLWADSFNHAHHTPKQFWGSHTFIDAQIGRLLNKIEERIPNALVVYTSDHGVFLEAHRLNGKGPAMYDEITHIPFLVRWPGHAPAASTSEGLVSHLDISGTLMEFFGFDVPKTMEGRSMLTLWKDPQTHIRDEVFIEWGRYEVDHDAFGGYQPIRCVFDGRYKLSINLLATDELYDLQTDPHELTNLIDSKEHAALRNSLHDRLLNWMDTTRDPFRGYYWGRRLWRQDFPATYENDGMTRQRENDGYLPRELDYNTGLTMAQATRTK